ncbi:LuxR family transcriptional regulator [Nocardioides coralli]|uniref:LuxR family transcriptional regulator n=1 Tax=Nocardioides coralli TaxID=2872154 RepID=UPI001CA3C06D|nr:LuxR family transcriptional regulator [Nocardioides coralli]QZY29281.1 LuxR family transcriptional regulator [Nocardioides coralli]
MRQLEPEDRALFESAATALYEDIVAAGGIESHDPRLAEGSKERAAFDLLLEIGLLTQQPDQERYVAIDPASVQSRIVSPLTQQGTRLLQESSGWAAAFGPLAQAWRRAPTETQGPFTMLHGSAIDPFIAGLVAECEEEMLTAQPQAGRDAPTLAAAAERDTAMLERGTRMRTLYQHSARRSSITHKYVAAVTARGAEVRTLDEFFNRMIAIDHRVVVIPGKAEDLTTAIVIREPSIVDYLVDVFERAWERGRPFTNREEGMLKDIAAEQRAMTIRMLIEGHADPVSAKRLGVSPRTYAGYVADLKREYEAETRFQLGYTMGRRGISGGKDDPAPPHGSSGGSSEGS